MRTVIVGSHHHSGAAVRAVERLKTGDALRLVREPTNKVDPRAVAVYDHAGQFLGYIPRVAHPQFYPLLGERNEIEAVVSNTAVIDEGRVRWPPKIEILPAGDLFSQQGAADG
jgi:hypothetical protein